MAYRKPKRFFEDSGLVDPRSAYHVELENVTNTKGHDIKTMVYEQTAGQPWLVNPSKYILTEQADEGFVVVFDPKRNVGEITDTEERHAAGRKVAVFVIAIGKTP